MIRDAGGRRGKYLAGGDINKRPGIRDFVLRFYVGPIDPYMEIGATPSDFARRKMFRERRCPDARERRRR
jgi:hypothetical protein